MAIVKATHLGLLSYKARMGNTIISKMIMLSGSSVQVETVEYNKPVDMYHMYMYKNKTQYNMYMYKVKVKIQESDSDVAFLCKCCGVL